MELPVIIYFISLFDSLWGLVGVLAALLIPAFFAMLFHTDEGENTEHYPFWQKYFKVHGIAIAVAGLCAFLAPNKETSYAMLAAYGVQTVAETEQVQEVAGKSLRVLEKYMDTYLGEQHETTD